MSYDYFYGQSGELFSYFRIPKALFQDCRFRQLSTDARTLYGILLDRMSLSAKNGWLDEQGRVYIIYTVRDVQESLCCAEHKAVKLFRELEDIDLIKRKRRGLGRPSLIYVKDFSSGLPKAQVQNCPNSNSSAAESAILEQPKPQANKTDKNKTEWNDPDPIYSGGIREQLEDYFYQALEVDLLLRLCPDEEDTIYQIVDLLVDTCSTKRKMLRIMYTHNLRNKDCIPLTQEEFTQKLADRDEIQSYRMKQFQQSGHDCYLVMQLHQDADPALRFAAMRYLNKQNTAPSIENYEILYRGNLPEGKRSVPQAELLEQLYQKFNLSRPQDFEGHSLSVSDVIALKRNGEVSVHYVDSIGFKDLQGFLDKKPERASVLMNLKEKCDAPECNPTVCRKARDEHEL